MRLLLLFLIVSAMAMVANAGKIMFYIPFSSTSVKMTYMPLVEEMAK
jgi:hypothetical protein